MPNTSRLQPRQFSGEQWRRIISSMPRGEQALQEYVIAHLQVADDLTNASVWLEPHQAAYIDRIAWTHDIGFRGGALSPYE